MCQKLKISLLHLLHPSTTRRSSDLLYMLDDTQRRLFTVANLLPRALAARLHKWIEGGRYADLFDNLEDTLDRKSTRLNSSHLVISYAVFCLFKLKRKIHEHNLLTLR